LNLIIVAMDGVLPYHDSVDNAFGRGGCTLAGHPAMPMTIDSTHRPARAADLSAEAGEPPQLAPAPGDYAIEIATSSHVRQTINLDWLRQRLAAAAALVSRDTGRPIDSIDLRIVSDTEMIQLHHQHGGELRTTDVLSFDLSEGGRGASIAADIVVCVDEAARQAAAFGHTLERELLLYAVHGVLHCAGFDDLAAGDYARMHAEEDRILNEIGVGATFSANPADTGHPGDETA
jgi:probable rRNA maturation factor